MEETGLSIVIVNWNTRDLLERCLRTVDPTSVGLDYEVVVVDNASTDNSASMVRALYPKVRLIENKENIGFARANNQAIQVSKGKYILLLNSDAFPADRAIQKMFDFMELNEAVGILGASLFYPDGKNQQSFGRLPTLYSEMKMLLGLDKWTGMIPNQAEYGAVETGLVSGACLLARRSVFEQVGLLDEGFFMFNEEIDLCYRARKAGWKVAHLPSAHVIHLQGGSTGWTPQRILMLYQAKLRYFAKHYGAAAERNLFRAMRLATITKIILYSLLRGLSRKQAHKVDFWRTVSKGLTES